MRAGKGLAALAAVAVAGLASSASAQNFSLSPSPTITGGDVTFSGTWNLQQVTSTNCAVSAIMRVLGGAGQPTANFILPSFSPGGSPLCGIAIYPVTPWSAQTNPGWTLPSTGSTTITVWIGMNGIVNDPCYRQPVQVELSTSPSGSMLIFNDVVLQATSGRFDRRCRINGVLTASGLLPTVFVH